ncbi:MAG: L-rhamnose isomerase [Clostridia bacterium]|nr:L-rhamnose isomerase [Clostridia bacterium]
MSNCKNSAFECAKAKYASYGIDVEKAMERIAKIPVSVHCWQGDDVRGFMSSGSLTGGIQTTGNYPYSAKTPDELMADYEYALSLVPGAKRINLHAIYAITDGKTDVDELTYEHFKPWVEFAKKNNVKIDFNPTLFSHPMVKDGLTLSSPDKATRDFWIKHVKACREIAAQIGREQGSPCLVNLWMGDGFKDTPADRLGPRVRLKESLDEIYAVKYDKKYIIDCVESKVFGIGVESYTVGSNEFYQTYSAMNGLCCLLDNGHYHPMEYVSDKIPAMLAFYDNVALHVTRPVRWDSDHVVAFDDELKEIACEIIRNDADEKVLIGLDYFDASINRIVAWVTGAQCMQKALLYAALQPYGEMKKMQDDADFSQLMIARETVKELPFGAVWEEYCARQGVPFGVDLYTEIKRYEDEVLAKR